MRQPLWYSPAQEAIVARMSQIAGDLGQAIELADTGSVHRLIGELVIENANLSVEQMTEDGQAK